MAAKTKLYVEISPDGEISFRCNNQIEVFVVDWTEIEKNGNHATIVSRFEDCMENDVAVETATNSESKEYFTHKFNYEYEACID